MKKLLFIMLVAVLAVGMATAQTYTAGTGLVGYDILGAHQNGGRGCAGCHAPHSGAAGGGGNAINGAVAFNDPSSGSVALFGQDVTPLFGYQLTLGNGIVEILPTQAAAYTTNTAELEDIMMCLACHDGVVAKGQMMNGQSWEQRVGILAGLGVYGTRPIPTLLGNDDNNGNTSGYLNDHPIGLNATLAGAGVWTNNASANGLTITVVNGAISKITPVGSYVTFNANYGYPAIAGTKWEYGVAVQSSDNGTGNTAFITCTTCHNQHQMYVYQGPPGFAPGSAKMAGSSIGTGTYPTYFFINSPYNPGAGNANAQAAVSTTQFCRQCHFDTANENFGITTVGTVY